MKERPILFKGEMVRAILEGRKTMTRRVVEPKPIDGKPWPHDGSCLLWPDERNYITHAHCPYGQPGDRLWVREAWRPLWDGIDEPGGLGDCVQYRADMAKRKPPLTISEDEGFRFDEMCVESCTEPRWRPSIHMPRWASRITLEVTGIKVERVQDISEEDAKAEGVQPPLIPTITHRNKFAVLWDSINAARGYGWSQNPWVWCVSFRRITP